MFDSRCCACRRRPVCTLSRHRNAKIGKDGRNGKKKRSFLAFHGRIIASIRETMMHKIRHSDKPNDAKFGRRAAAMPTDEGVRGGSALSEFFIKGRCLANYLTLRRLAYVPFSVAKEAVLGSKTGRFGARNMPFCIAKRQGRAGWGGFVKIYPTPGDKPLSTWQPRCILPGPAPPTAAEPPASKPTRGVTFR